MSDMHDSKESRPTSKPRSNDVNSSAVSYALKISFVLALVFAALTIRTVWDRTAQTRALAAMTSANAAQYVTAVYPQAESAQRLVTLPGTLMGYTESPIYARSTGYVAHWYKDIGDVVKQGDLLAAIATPEVDRQLSQAQAVRRQVAANLDLAAISARRWTRLRAHDAVSQQELDERQSAFAQARANLAAADAEVNRLQELERFKNITAPFSGMVTRRNIDIGALVDAGSEGTGQELFRLTKVDMLKTYVYVPEAYAPRIKLGQAAKIKLSELPGQIFDATVTKMANAIDTVTRSMQIEVDLPNQQGVLKPGSYVDVQLALPSGQGVVIPVNTLLFRAEGLRVAVIQPNGQVKSTPVTVGEDFGTTVEIVQGIKATDKLVLNPADSLEDGQKVAVR